MRPRRRRRRRWPSLIPAPPALLLLPLLLPALLLGRSGAGADQPQPQLQPDQSQPQPDQPQPQPQPQLPPANGNGNGNGNGNASSNRDLLDEDSVVLITGAAGFLGSELALALRSTYGVGRILCVDSMASGFGPGPGALAARTEGEWRDRQQAQQGKGMGEGGGGPPPSLRARTEEELALFEFKRQRAFRLLQHAGEAVRFYRADFRPTLPEYHDTGEVPLLDSIFRSHPDITHVVHLADPYHAALPEELVQAVPRTKDQPRSGMMEALMEQLKKVADERAEEAGDGDGDGGSLPPGARAPHFVYASSYEVYNHVHPYPEAGDGDGKGGGGPTNPNPPPFREDRTLTVPSSLRGTSKAIDEIIAATYRSYHGLYSVALRLFPVYGPWGIPGTPLFEMAETAVSDPWDPVLEDPADGSGEGEEGGGGGEGGGGRGAVPRTKLHPDDVRDYVYIDDAVDAIMTAMQYRPSPPIGGEGDDGGGSEMEDEDVDEEGWGRGRKEEKDAAGEDGEDEDEDGAPFSPPNVVINVGTGRGSSLRDVARLMEAHLPRQGGAEGEDPVGGGGGGGGEGATVSIASTRRAEVLLDFKPRVDLEEGIARLLAWHGDRASPYGGRAPLPSQGGAPGADGGGRRADGGEGEGGIAIGGGDEKDGTRNQITGGHRLASLGIEACSPFDRDCLKGAPVFPCASECSRRSQCTPSFLDDAAQISRSVTAGCDAVLYTVHLGDDVATIPSAHTAVSQDSAPYVEGNGGRCNVAFVSEGSDLVGKIKMERGIAPHVAVSKEFLRRVNGGNGKEAADVLLSHGFWTLIPVASPQRDASDEDYDDWHLLRLLPKVSPGLFFSGRTKHAVYADPDVSFGSIPQLLREATMQPYKEGMRGATAAIVGDGPAESERRIATGARGSPFEPMQQGTASARSEALQLRAYNMIRVGLQGEMQGGGSVPIVDSSWIVHALGVEDARLFRCDVYGEVVQWEAGSDERSMEFVMGLHDLWSRIIVTWGGVDPWWKKREDTNITVVPVVADPDSSREDEIAAAPRKTRRLTDVTSLSPSPTTASDEDVPPEFERRRLEEEADVTGSDPTVSSDADEGTWLGVLSSTEVHYFVRILPSASVSAVHVD